VLRSLRSNEATVEQPPSDLIIDTDHSDPEQSAQTIIAAFGLHREHPVQRYPENP
jgi:hypothetical protein